jgi:hypothetical protein
LKEVNLETYITTGKSGVRKDWVASRNAIEKLDTTKLQKVIERVYSLVKEVDTIKAGSAISVPALVRKLEPEELVVYPDTYLRAALIKLLGAGSVKFYSPSDKSALQLRVGLGPAACPPIVITQTPP